MTKPATTDCSAPQPDTLFGRTVSQSSQSAILHPTGGESVAAITELKLAVAGNQYPAGTESPQGFLPQLTWLHYRALMRVESRP
jgi:hypothetical protein